MTPMPRKHPDLPEGYSLRELLKAMTHLMSTCYACPEWLRFYRTTETDALYEKLKAYWR